MGREKLTAQELLMLTRYIKTFFGTGSLLLYGNC